MKNKIYIFIMLIIILGIVLIGTIGFNVSLDYSNHTMLEIYIGKDFNISDIKNATDEVIPNSRVIIEKASEFEDTAYIKLDGISEEQKNLLCQKINEKLGTEIKAEDMYTVEIGSTRLRDLVKPYVMPVSIATIAILVYMGIKHKKEGTIKVILETLMHTVIAEVLYLAILAITRCPINKIIMPSMLIIYFAIVILLNLKFEKNKTIKMSK